MTQKNLSTQDLEIITTISDSKKTKVSLVTITETEEFAVLKQYTDKQSLCCYEQIRALQSAFFPEVYNVWEENDEVFLLEEYVSGVTLQEKLEKELLFSEAELYDLAQQICMALQTLHNATPPIIHRDVKPENIIVLPDGKIKLIDFDAAREYNAEKEHDTILMGTKQYASPEQFGFMQTDMRSDIYSFGIVFSELLSHANVSSSYESKARKIINKATMFDPEERYTNESQLLKDLALLKKRKFNLVPWLILAGLVCVLIIAVVLVKFNNRTTDDNSSLALNTNEDLQPTTTPELPTEEIIESETVEQDTIEQDADEQITDEQITFPEPIDDFSKETLTLAEVYNYIDITDELNPTAIYLMEERGDLFNGIPTSGFPEGMYSMTQECIIGSEYVVCRFLKGYPRDIFFCDYRLENVVEAYIYPYLEESGTNGEKIELTSDDYTQEFNDVVSISKDYLQTLEPGAYTLYLKTPNVYFPVYLIVHGEEEKVDKFYPRPINEINYYSSNKQNDVVFYSTGTPYPIKEVRMDGNILDPENYTLVDGGFGIVFKPNFLEKYKDLEAIEMVYVTENDREGGVRIINISNFQ